MLILPRALRLPLTASLLAGAVPLAFAQTAAPNATAAAPFIASRGAWLYKGSDITPDPEWRFGTLTNGLRYAVRRNGVPPGQISIRVRIDAGSLMETDQQRGYAHLIEHLSFRGSAYVPDGEAKRIWQRFGATFGSDTNASTTATQTVYKLDLPSATSAGIDESLKIIAGMVEQPAITAQGLAAERPAVLAEQREQPGPQVRLSDAASAVFFAGQPMAARSPIGNIKTLEAATPASVQAFHDRWYRPERAVVVVSGDADPAMLERLVAQHFGAWRGVGPAPADPDFGKPDPAKPRTGSIAEPGLPPVIQYAVVRPWKYNDDTVVFNQERLVDQIALDVINRRLETRARAGGSYVSAQVQLDDPARSVNGTFLSIIPVGDNWEAALKDVRAVIADAISAPPSKAEVEREVAERAVVFKTLVDTARLQPGGKLADDMVEAVDIRETTTAPSTINAVFLDARTKGMFTPARVFASTRRVFEGVATRAIVNTQAPDPAAGAKLAAALDANVKGLAGKRQTQGAVTFAKLPRLGPPATVVSRDSVPGIGVERIVYSNGVRLLVYPSPPENGRLFVRVRFGGGYNALPADRPSPVWAGEVALVPSGIGKLKQGDIDALTAGRRLGLDFDVGEDAFTLSTVTSPADLADELKLMAAKLATPGWDPDPVARARTYVLASYTALGSSPSGVLTRDLEGLLHAGDPRWGVPSRDQVMGTTPQAFRALWEPVLASGPVEVEVFGDVKSDDAIRAVAETIGALKPRAADARAAPPVRFPAHNAAPVVRTHDGPANQAAGVIAWPTGGGIENITDSRRLDVLAAIFNDRLFDRLRSEAGASYSPSVSSDWPVGMAGGGRLVAIGQVPPDKLPLFFTLARQIAADLAAKPVGDDELKRTIGPMTQLILRQSTGSQFWMLQLGGASYDPRRIDALRRMYHDITAMTAVELQDTARKYLRSDADWTMEVVPKAPAAAAAAAR